MLTKTLKAIFIKMPIFVKLCTRKMFFQSKSLAYKPSKIFFLGIACFFLLVSGILSNSHESTTRAGKQPNTAKISPSAQCLSHTNQPYLQKRRRGEKEASVSYKKRLLIGSLVSLVVIIIIQQKLFSSPQARPNEKSKKTILSNSNKNPCQRIPSCADTLDDILKELFNKRNPRLLRDRTKYFSSKPEIIFNLLDASDEHSYFKKLAVECVKLNRLIDKNGKIGFNLGAFFEGDVVDIKTYQHRITFFLEQGAKINQYVDNGSREGGNFLHIALRSQLSSEEKLQMVKFLVNKGAMIEFKYQKYALNSLLFTATRNKNTNEKNIFAIIKFLVKKNQIKLNESYRNKDNLLAQVIKKDDIFYYIPPYYNMIKLLLELGSNPDPIDNNQPTTSLHVLIRKINPVSENIQIAHCLLTYGADLYRQFPKSGNTYLHEAV
ncbi:MAG: hypothetical protein ACPGC9_00420, partial [Cytophagales bacterium]